MLSGRSEKAPHISLLSFKDAFSGRRVKKILCGEVKGLDLRNIGFSEADEIDQLRIEYFHNQCSNGKEMQNKLSTNTMFDIRFMAKLAIGLSYVLFGKQSLNSKHASELYKALWYRTGDEQPNVRGTGNYSQDNAALQSLLGVENGVTITLMPVERHIMLNLNVNKNINSTICCAPLDNIAPEKIEKLGSGICYILFKPIRKFIEISLPKLIAHESGDLTHPELKQVEEMRKNNRDYLKSI